MPRQSTTKMTIKLSRFETLPLRRLKELFSGGRLFSALAPVFVIAVFIVACFQSRALAAPDESSNPFYGRVLVVANSRSPASLELASIYCRHRNIPPANLLLIPFQKRVTISSKECRQQLIAPLRERYKQLNEVPDYVVLVRGVPYRTGKIATTTAILFGGPDKLRPVHGYFQRREVFDSSIPYFGEQLMPATVLSAYTVEEGEKLIERSNVVYSNPKKAGTFYFCDGAGPRGSRNRQIEPAVEKMRGMGFRAVHVPHPSIRNRDDVLVQLTGHTRLDLGSNTYRPGSIVDNMTSFGGYLFENKSQMSILTFIAHGACGAYGTVHEPTNTPTRWAAYDLPIDYVRGFSLAESYLQNIRDYKFGTVVGDPLMRPFAKPPEADIRIDKISPGTDQPVTAEIAMREGIEGEGISHAEVWLDDRYKVVDWTPAVPADTVCKLEIQHGDEEPLLSRKITVQVPETLPRVLKAFTERVHNKLEILVVGRQHNKLLIRWKPEKGEPADLKATFTMQTPDRGYRRTSQMLKRPILMQTAVLNFGAVPPAKGESVEIILAGEKEEFSRQRDESFADFMARIKAKLETADPVRQPSGYRVVYETSKKPDGKVEHRLALVPFRPLESERFEFEVNVKRKPDSEFATPLAKTRDPWQVRPVAVLGETVLQPLVPVPHIRQSVPIAADQLCPGWHQLTLSAVTPRGARSVATTKFFKPAADYQRGQAAMLQMSRTHFDLGEKMFVGLCPGTIDCDSYPLLVIDGRPVYLWPKNALMGSFVLTTPFISPGQHELWVEWIRQDEIPDPQAVRNPVLSSRRHQIWIRRPLDAELKWWPKNIDADSPVKLKFRGPYLHENLQLFVGGHNISLQRQSKDGFQFSAELPALSAGTYRVLLLGDPEKESGFQLAPGLKVGAEPE